MGKRCVSHTERSAELLCVSLWCVQVTFSLYIHTYLQDVKILGILDTGGQTSVLNTAAAKALGLTEDAGGRVQTSELNAYGVDRTPIPLKYAGFGDIRLGGTLRFQSSSR